MLHRLRFNRSHGNAKLQRIPRSASRPRRLRRSRRIPRGGRSGFARWSRSRSCSRRSCFSLAHRVRRCIRRRHMPAAGRFTPEPRQERRCERGTARPQVLHRDLREPVCRKMKSPRQINALGLFRELPATAGNPITCCRSRHGNRVQALVAQRSVPFELCPVSRWFPRMTGQRYCASDRLKPLLGQDEL